MKRYRGNRYRRRNKILLTILILLIVFLLGACAFFVAENYVVFTSTGLEIRLPFLRQREVSAVDDDPPLQIEELPQQPSQEQTTPPEEPVEEVPEEPEDPSPETLWAVAADVGRLTEQAYLEELLAMVETTGVNAVMIDLKNQDGTLNYVSTASAAVAANAAAGAQDIAPAIQRLRDGGVYVIGRVYCMRDNTVSRQVRSTSIKTASGATWLDWEYEGWLSPYEQSAREYLAQVVGECAALGVSEIVLDDFCFPYRGKLEVIAYPEGAESKEDALSTLLEELAAVCAQTETELSVMPMRECVETGSAPEQGQVLSTLAEHARRIYFAVQEGEVAAAVPGIAERINAFASEREGFAIPVVEVATGNRTALEALLQEQGSSFVLQNSTGVYNAEDFE